jgi:hypothetical protein
MPVVRGVVAVARPVITLPAGTKGCTRLYVARRTGRFRRRERWAAGKRTHWKATAEQELMREGEMDTKRREVEEASDTG